MAMAMTNHPRTALRDFGADSSKRRFLGRVEDFVPCLLGYLGADSSLGPAHDWICLSFRLSHLSCFSRALAPSHSRALADSQSLPGLCLPWRLRLHPRRCIHQVLCKVQSNDEYSVKRAPAVPVHFLSTRLEVNRCRNYANEKQACIGWSW